MAHDLDRVRAIKSFPSLIKYLRDDLGWEFETDDVEDLTFDYEPEELGLDAETAVKIKEIKQLRPLITNQPWGIFYINFEPKRLPVVVLRRVLRSLVLKRRAGANRGQQAAWKLHDLLFISSYGEKDERAITFAHFSDASEVGGLPTLKVLGWDAEDTLLHLEDAHRTLREKLRFPDDPSDAEAWRAQWASAFTLRHREVVTTSIELAKRLAELATLIRERANRVLAIESDKGAFRRLHEAFKEALIHDLSADDFADMYAQTIAYGLLSARVARPEGFIADNLVEMVPSTNPFLKELLGTFIKIGGRDRGKNVAAIDFDELGINEVVELLRRANMEAVLRDFGNRNPTEDPVIHFYELFLKEYNPVKRMKRGVFYTPRPVVSFIVRSVDEILRKEFGLADGLADTTTWGEFVKAQRLHNPQSEIRIPEGVKPDAPFVQILDPATGTGTFLVETIDVIYATLTEKWRGERKTEAQIRELWNDYVPKHLLPRLYGFELMMAPYSIAHMKIGLKLRETHYSFLSSERARIYLTNTLEEPKDFSGYFAQMAPALAHEAAEANTIKRHTPITVVIGNPPYSGISNNMNAWIDGLLKGKLPDGTKVRSYYEIDGNPLGEKKLWLQDDYVKFVRYSHWLLGRIGTGVHGMITNNSFLDSPTCRGMRYCLSVDFSNLALLDLHGSSKKQETPPEGMIDENVFDIQQGVAVSLFWNIAASTQPEVKTFELWGTRNNKYQWLNDKQHYKTTWLHNHISSPYYFFAKKELKTADEHKSLYSLKEVLPFYGTGIQTSRDDFAIDLEHDVLQKRLAGFFDKSKSDAEVRRDFKLSDTRGWKLADIRRDTRLKDVLSSIVPFDFRVFDKRWIALSKSVVDWTREEVMSCVLDGNNIGLLCSRQQATIGFRHLFVVNSPVDMFCISNKSREGQTLFPLYRPDDSAKSKFLGNHESIDSLHNRRANLAPQFVADFAERLNLRFLPDGRGDLSETFAPEDVFHYIYAVFHAPAYRTRYSEFLKIDFPRVPLTTDTDLFRQLCARGADLVALHLLEDDYPAASWNVRRAGASNPLARTLTKFLGANGEVAKGYPKYDDGDVQINPSSRFTNVPEAVWNFHVGGYQVCHKWLKDRRGRTLTDEDTQHYVRVVSALDATIRLMAEIDETIEAHGGWPLVGSQDAAPKEATSTLPFA
ncbi:MAG: DNA methyltransferase [Pyrinomonadaceae bacterium]|nr:DNA methyltransferase [Pyrinomonadaceae bacterium]